MEDNLQVIIYIVFLAIYFLSRFLKGNKKQAQRPTREREREYEEDQGQEAEQPMTFEDLLRELTQPKERKPKPTPQPPPAPAKREYEFSGEEPSDDEIQEVYEESKRKAKGVKTLDEMVDIGEESIKFKEYQEVGEDNEFATEIREMLQNTDDARKAIVLKEILERKF